MLHHIDIVLTIQNKVDFLILHQRRDESKEGNYFSSKEFDSKFPFFITQSIFHNKFYI